MHSSSTIIASSGVFQIEFLEKVHNEDFGDLIRVSKALEKEFGLRAILTESTIEKYFNHSKSLPFIARYRGEIIGYIIGIPLEELSQEPWVITEKNFGKKNTIYTYAFVIMDLYRKNGYAKMLKKVFLSKTEKLKDINYVTGHVAKGISSSFSGNIDVIDYIKNWQGTGREFEYYRRTIN
jgi:GNAT superfamily N-acetyltransferase